MSEKPTCCVGCEGDKGDTACSKYTYFWDCPQYKIWIAELVKTFPEPVIKLRESMKRYFEDLNCPLTFITCDTCSDREKCEWSYDPYNTEGDCLGVK